MVATAREMAERYATAYNERDLTTVRSLYAPDCVDAGPFGALKGVDEVTEDVERMWAAFPDMRIELVSVVGDDQHRADEYVMRATHTGPLTMPDGTTVPPSGRYGELRCATFTDLRDGLIVDARTYFDTAELMAVLAPTS